MTTLRMTAQKNAINLDRLENSNKFRFVRTRDSSLRLILPFWSLVNLDLFKNLKKQVDMVLMAIPNSMPYLGFLSPF